MVIRLFSNWIYRVSNGWVALVALLIFLLFTALVLPGQAAEADMGREDIGSPDLSFYYTAGDLYRMAAAYGAQGRVAYVRARFTFDLVWPVVYTLFLTTAISWLYGRGTPPQSLWRYANLAPLLGMLLDYLENISTSLVMYRYPQPTDLAARLAPLFTMLKWIFVNGSFLLLLIGLAAVLWRRLRARPEA